MDNFNIEGRVEALEELIRLTLGAGSVPGSVLHGQTTLVNGVSPIVPVPNLLATSSVVLLERVQVADGLTVEYVALTADRVFGAGGSFRARSILVGGGGNLADQSTLDWIVIL